MSEVRLAVAATLLRWLRLATLMITAGTLFGFALPLLVGNTGIYRSLTQQVVAFGTLTVVVVVVGVYLVVDRPLGPVRWVLLAAVGVASALATTGIPAALLMSEAEWSYGVIGWFGVLLLLDRGVAAVAVFLGAFTLVSFGQVIVLGQDVLGLVVVTVLLLGCQLPVVAVAMALRGVAVTATNAARRAEWVRTAEAIANQLHDSRRARYAELATTTVPLLTALSTGTARLTDQRVRAEYAVEAAKLRRLFAENDDVPDPLLHELAACLDLAERNGVAVYLGSCGDRPTPPLAVRRALTEPVLRVTAAAVSEARVTVLGTDASVTVSVVAVGVPGAGVPADPPAGPVVGAAPVTVTQLVDGTKVWVEARWNAKD